MTCSMILNKSI